MSSKKKYNLFVEAGKNEVSTITAFSGKKDRSLFLRELTEQHLLKLGYIKKEKAFKSFQEGKSTARVEVEAYWKQKIQELKLIFTKSREFWIKEYNASNRKDKRSEAMCECLMRIDDELAELISEVPKGEKLIQQDVPRREIKEGGLKCNCEVGG